LPSAPDHVRETLHASTDRRGDDGNGRSSAISSGARTCRGDMRSWCSLSTRRSPG